jgi:homoaconitase/3-isopropylmalate dehydratase large subunit
VVARKEQEELYWFDDSIIVGGTSHTGVNGTLSVLAPGNRFVEI